MEKDKLQIQGFVVEKGVELFGEILMCAMLSVAVSRAGRWPERSCYHEDKSTTVG